MSGLHEQVKKKAKNGVLKIDELKPNSREVAQRMIERGDLIQSRCGKGFVWSRV